MTIKFDYINQLTIDNSIPSKLELEILNTISTQQQECTNMFFYDVIFIFLLLLLFSTKYSDNLVSSLFPCFKDNYIITLIKTILFSLCYFIFKPYLS